MRRPADPCTAYANRSHRWKFIGQVREPYAPDQDTAYALWRCKCGSERRNVLGRVPVAR